VLGMRTERRQGGPGPFGSESPKTRVAGGGASGGAHMEWNSQGGQFVLSLSSGINGEGLGGFLVFSEIRIGKKRPFCISGPRRNSLGGGRPVGRLSFSFCFHRLDIRNDAGDGFVGKGLVPTPKLLCGVLNVRGPQAIGHRASEGGGGAGAQGRDRPFSKTFAFKKGHKGRSEGFLSGCPGC